MKLLKASDQNILREYFSQPHINITGLAELAGVNTQQLHDSIKNRKPFSKNMVYKLFLALAPFNFCGYWITKNEEYDILIINKIKQSKYPKDIDGSLYFPQITKMTTVSDGYLLFEWIDSIEL